MVLPNQLFLMFQLEEVWSFKFGDYAYPHAPGLPYAPFIKYAMYQITEQSLDKMKEHWEVQLPVCETNLEGEALSFQKIIFMFLILFFGIICAIITLLYELNKSRKEIQRTNGLRLRIQNQYEEIYHFQDIMKYLESMINYATKSKSTIRIIVVDSNTED